MEKPSRVENELQDAPRTRLTPRVRRVLQLLATGGAYTIQEILVVLGLPVGPRHRGAYTAVHRTLAALCRSGVVAKDATAAHFETTYALTEAGMNLVPESTPLPPVNAEARVAAPSGEGRPIPEEVVVSCPLCGPAWRVPGKYAARALRALDAGEAVTCACGKDLTGLVLIALEEFFDACRESPVYTTRW